MFSLIGLIIIQREDFWNKIRCFYQSTKIVGKQFHKAPFHKINTSSVL